MRASKPEPYATHTAVALTCPCVLRALAIAGHTSMRPCCPYGRLYEAQFAREAHGTPARLRFACGAKVMQ